MVNSERIGDIFNAACAGVLPVFLSEAETEDYPYLVYTSTVTPVVCKDGVIGYTSSLNARIYSNDFDDAESKAADVADAVQDNIPDNYLFIPATLERSCTDGVWEISLTWNVKQTTL